VFKSVEYVGFEDKPELRALAEQATPVLGALIRSWRDEVAVTWRPAPHDSRHLLKLTLSLTLRDSTGSATGGIRNWVFEPGEEGELRSDLREVWLDLLAILSKQQVKRLDEMLREPVEA
jgi:hypothetical protein